MLLPKSTASTATATTPRRSTRRRRSSSYPLRYCQRQPKRRRRRFQDGPDRAGHRDRAGTADGRRLRHGHRRLAGPPRHQADKRRVDGYITPRTASVSALSRRAALISQHIAETRTTPTSSVTLDVTYSLGQVSPSELPEEPVTRWRALGPDARGPLRFVRSSAALLFVTRVVMPGKGVSGHGTPPASLFIGLVDGLVAALCAATIVLVHRTLRIINFAAPSLKDIAKRLLHLLQGWPNCTKNAVPATSFSLGPAHRHARRHRRRVVAASLLPFKPA